MFEIRIHRGISILLIVFSFGLLTACQSSGLSTETSTPTQTVNSTAPSATPDPESIEENSEPSLPKSGPTPVPQEWVELPVPEAENAELLIKNADDSLSVFLDEENLDDRHHPAMPGYIWPLNAKVEGIVSIVVEFDLIDTVDSDDLYFYGYDRGYFIGLHNLDDVSDVLFYFTMNTNEWDITMIDDDPGKLSHLTAENKLYYPELAEDLSRYTTSDVSGHYVVNIPYEQFNGGASDLVLQFLPGATYANVRIYVDGDESFDAAKLEELTAEKAPILVEDFNDLTSWMGAEAQSLEGMIWRDVTAQIATLSKWSPNVISDGLINTDGTANMYLADYDLEGYEDEIIGDFGVVPEGIMALIMAVDDSDFLSFSRNRTALVTFVLDNMVDPETGLIYGVWDNAQGALFATDRVSGATLQIASAMLATNDVDHTRIQALFDAVIEHEILEINNTYYYVPGGEIGEDGTIELDLADFAVTDSFLHYFLDMIWYDKEDQQEDPLATYKMLEGFANSLELLLEGQEQNPTNLPADTLTVTFNEDGTYNFESIGEFHMDNLFFSVLPISQGHNYASATSGFQFMMAEKFDELIEHFLTAKGDGNEEYATQELDQARKIASYYQNSMRIVNTSYQMYYDVYNFIKLQDGNTIFAAGYDVYSGDIILRDSVGEEDGSAPWDVYQQRFGASNTAVNYAFMNLFFHDQDLSREALKMVLTTFAMFDGYVLNYEVELDMSDPETISRFFEKGYSIVGNDGVWVERYFCGHTWPSASSQRAAFDDAENFAWRDQSLDVFMERMLRQAGYYGED